MPLLIPRKDDNVTPPPDWRSALAISIPTLATLVIVVVVVWLLFRNGRREARKGNPNAILSHEYQKHLKAIRKSNKKKLKKSNRRKWLLSGPRNDSAEEEQEPPLPVYAELGDSFRPPQHQAANEFRTWNYVEDPIQMQIISPTSRKPRRHPASPNFLKSKK